MGVATEVRSLAGPRPAGGGAPIPRGGGGRWGSRWASPCQGVGAPLDVQPRAVVLHVFVLEGRDGGGSRAVAGGMQDCRAGAVLPPTPNSVGAGAESPALSSSAPGCPRRGIRSGAHTGTDPCECHTLQLSPKDPRHLSPVGPPPDRLASTCGRRDPPNPVGLGHHCAASPFGLHRLRTPVPGSDTRPADGDVAIRIAVPSRANDGLL